MVEDVEVFIPSFAEMGTSISDLSTWITRIT